MKCSLASAISILSLLSFSSPIVFSLSFEFTGFKLYKVTPENETQINVLLILRNSNSGLFFWNGIDKVGKEVDILVSPDVRLYFLEHMISQNLGVKEYFSDVKILMRHESPANQIDAEIPKNDSNVNVNATLTVRSSFPKARSINLDEEIKNNTIRDISAIPIERIPGTSLFTGIFYTIGMLRYQRGYVTWVGNTTGNGHYVQTDFRPSHQEDYTQGGKSYADAKWILAPTEEPNYYLLINQNLSQGIFTWTTEKSPNGHFVQLSTKEEDRPFYQAGNKWRNDCLVRINSTEVSDHYIIQIKGLNPGIVTWTNKYGGDDFKYLQVDVTNDSRFNYHPGQKWRDDVLFKFFPAKNTKLSGTISNFQYQFKNTTYAPARRINMFSTGKLVVPNNSGITQSLSVKDKANISNDYIFHFDGSNILNQFSNLSCLANVPFKTNSQIHLYWNDTRKTENNTQEMKKSVQGNYFIDSVVSIQPFKTLEAEWYCDYVENLEVKFTAQIAVKGFIEIMSTDRKVHEIPLSIVDVYDFINKENEHDDIEIVSIHRNEVLISVKGTFKGSYAIKDSFVTTNV